MGWNVISKCYLSFDADKSKEIKDFLKSKGGFYYNQDFEESGEFYFEISGNNGVDYTELEELRDYCKKNKIGIEIACYEYSEVGDGFYYNSHEVKCPECGRAGKEYFECMCGCKFVE